MMNLTRRTLVRAGGAFLAGAAFHTVAYGAAPAEIRMQGNASGSHVWFDPVGLRVQPGQTIRWINMDAGNAHTATAYHPSYDNHPLRIPAGAQPWNSDYLLPNESFEVTLTVEGVYDYFCIPHEHTGMVGRIVVGHPQVEDAPYPGVASEALGKLPSVREIMSAGRIRPGEG